MIQNSACRIILQVDKETSIDQMHKELELLKLKDRRQYHLSVECYKNVTNESTGLHKLFVPKARVAARVTRLTEANTMIVPNIVSDTGRKAFSYRGPRHWNTVSTEMRNVDKLTTFKNKLMKQMLRDVNHPG